MARYPNFHAVTLAATLGIALAACTPPPTPTSEPEAAPRAEDALAFLEEAERQLAAVRQRLQGWVDDEDTASHDRQLLRALGEAIEQRAATDPRAALQFLTRLPRYAERLMLEQAGEAAGETRGETPGGQQPGGDGRR